VSGLRERVVALDRAHVWHPYTQHDLYEAGDPFVIARAEGVWLEDLDGRRYLDANASWWVSTLGHNHPRLVAALRAQAERLCHVSLAGTTHEGAAMLAAELSRVAPPGLTRAFFSDDGSTAVEAAVKMAVQYHHQNGGARRAPKDRVIALDAAFHGETVGASSLGGVELFRRPFHGLLFDCLRLPSPAEGGEARALEALAALLARQADQVAALVLEPLVQGAAGMAMYGPELLREARALATRHDVLLVLDEVFTGFGRTGAMWAAEHAGITPDLLCLAKGLTGGLLPMGATLATEAVFDGFRGERARAFFHGHSYAGNPLGCAVAREVLAVFRDEGVLAALEPKVARLRERFLAMSELEGVRSPRALGLIGALELAPVAPRARAGRSGAGAPRETIESEADLEPTGYLGEAGWRVYQAARERGAYLRPLGDTVYVCPALTITSDELERLLDVVEDSVRAVCQAR
jgi:adenosylmethionine-8-amino-7-oxononanoate aminotransferase